MAKEKSPKDKGKKAAGGRKKMVRADKGRLARSRSAVRDDATATARREPRRRQAGTVSAARVTQDDRARKTATGKTATRKSASRSTGGSDRQVVMKALLFRLAHPSPRAVVWAALLVLFVVLSISPVGRNLEATARLKKAEGELAEQQSVTRSLEREVEEAKSLEYVEREARRQRLVAPGEVLYLVTTRGEQKVEYRVKALQSMDEAWERVRGMLHCGASRQAGSR